MGDVASVFRTLWLAVAAGPVFWYLWLIRDRNKLVEIQTAQTVHVREHFDRLRGRMVAANSSLVELELVIREVEIYILRPRNMIPEEVRHLRSDYSGLAQGLIRNVIESRADWDEMQGKEAVEWYSRQSKAPHAVDAFCCILTSCAAM